MGRAPCCDKDKVKKGPWSPEEDAVLKEFIGKNGTGGNWISLPQKAGLKRCGKSCRLRWLNYLRPNIKHGEFSDEEDRIICTLFGNIGSRWSIIAAQLPGRTDNDIKNYWNTKLKKKFMAIIPFCQHTKLTPLHHPHQPSSFSSSSSFQSPSAPLIKSNDINAYHNYSIAPLPFSASPPLSTSNSLITTTTTSNTSLVQSQESFVGSRQQEHQDQFDSFVGSSLDVVRIGGGGLEEYGLDEINKLISSKSSSNCSNFLLDESKTLDNNGSVDESFMYY